MQMVCHDFTNFVPGGTIFKGIADKITGQNRLNKQRGVSCQSFVVKPYSFHEQMQVLSDVTALSIRVIVSGEDGFFKTKIVSIQFLV